MKKVLIVLFSLLIVLTSLLTYFGLTKRVDIEFYSIPEAKGYVIDTESEIEFEVYSKAKSPAFLVLDDTIFYYVLDNESYLLNDIRIESYDLGEFYLFKIFSKAPSIIYNEISSKTSLLRIINSSYTLELDYGPVAFLKDNSYKLLSISNLYGSYGYINGHLYMLGINIEIDGEYDYLKSIRMGDIFYGSLNRVIANSLYENILEPEFVKELNPKRVEKDYYYELKDKSLFIPIGYSSLSLFRKGYLVLNLDNEYYYVDEFKYMSNSYDPDDYRDLMIRGIINA